VDGLDLMVLMVGCLFSLEHDNVCPARFSIENCDGGPTRFSVGVFVFCDLCVACLPFTVRNLWSFVV
jgi:hypothetical protein